jgi:hypothetical protein
VGKDVKWKAMIIVWPIAVNGHNVNSTVFRVRALIVNGSDDRNDIIMLLSELLSIINLVAPVDFNRRDENVT